MSLLLCFAQQSTGKAPFELDIADLDAPLIGAFLAHLESDRGVSVRTRNARLSAVRSLFRFAAFRHPEHSWLIQRVLAIPPKRFDRALVTFLTGSDRSTRCWPVQTARPGSAVVTTPFLWSPCRPGFAFPSSPGSAAVMSNSEPEHTCAVAGRDESTVSHHSPPGHRRYFELGCMSVRVRQARHCFQGHATPPSDATLSAA